MQVVDKPFVPYWLTELDEAEVARVSASIRGRSLSQGAVTEELEKRLSELLRVPYVVATTSGSMSLYMAMYVAGVRPGYEVILPNRTFVATAHAAMMAGGRVVIVDVEAQSPVIDPTLIESAITSKTRAICAVHLNGRASDMRAIRAIAARHGLMVIEDAAQAFCSSNSDGYLGTQSDLGCFSLGVTKFITTGQGGFVTTHDAELYAKLQHFRNHGVLSTYASQYHDFGFNLKFTDIQASIGLAQLEKVPAKIRRHIEIYRRYERGLTGLPFLRILPLDIEGGELPLWVEALVSERDRAVELLAEENIQARPFLPDLSEASHLQHDDTRFVNSKRFARHGLWLPSGPSLSDEAIDRTIAVLHQLAPRLPALAES